MLEGDRLAFLRIILLRNIPCKYCNFVARRSANREVSLYGLVAMSQFVHHNFTTLFLLSDIYRVLHPCPCISAEYFTASFIVFASDGFTFAPFCLSSSFRVALETLLVRLPDAMNKTTKLPGNMKQGRRYSLDCFQYVSVYGSYIQASPGPQELRSVTTLCYYYSEK